MNSKLFWASVFLIAFIFGLYGGMAVPMRPYADLFAGLALQLGIAIWLDGDIRRRGYRPAFDSKTFLFFAWPVVGPYYLFRTRGWKGLVPILGFIALLTMGYVGGALTGAGILRV